jgi:hypothetical protein
MLGSSVQRTSRWLDGIPVRATGVDARGPSLRGPTAIGALAVGATALGAVAIGRLAIGRAVIKRLVIEELEVGRLKVTELEVVNERRPPSPTSADRPRQRRSWEPAASGAVPLCANMRGVDGRRTPARGLDTRTQALSRPSPSVTAPTLSDRPPSGTR